MSNLRIFYPHIPESATRIRTSDTFATTQTEYNLINGHRYQRAQLSSAQATPMRVEYDLGSSGAATCDYLAVARADLLSSSVSLIRVQGSTVSCFTPTDVGTPALWFDACEGVTYNGSNEVSQWSDLSGNARHATQSTTSKKPIYVAGGTNGLPHLDFAGGDDALLTSTGFTLAQPNTIFIVAKYDAAAADQTLFSSASGSGRQMMTTTGGGSYALDAGSFVSTGQGATTGTTYVFSVVFNTSSSKFFRDGTQYGGTMSLGTDSLVGLGIGTDAGAGTPVGHDGTICEILVYNSALSDANRQAVEAYLTTKWKTAAVADVSSFSTLYGFDDHDYATSFTASSSFRYWWAYYAASASTKFEHSKFYIGNQINFANDATVNHSLDNSSQAQWLASAGTQTVGRSERPVYEIEAEWQGLTDSEISLFLNKVAKNSHKSGFFLYTAAEHQMLDSQRLIHCTLSNFEWKRVGKTNYNELRTTWREMLG